MTKASILIVEDDASLAEVLDYNLHQEGYETQVAHDGQQGLREIRLRCPDVVILIVSARIAGELIDSLPNTRRLGEIKRRVRGRFD